ncbi:hypothetical protein ACFFMR_17105 [Micromonospora andamanensis]|uniref:Uncharacterized protein n=1 Tax=Micromonospora andamanensis TaxID=1287068 RepID=A0ABQ4HZ69_9ACTN|nr:hypothetical protein [Micromonospora andamanensis]GIJ10959.1 hypothetical protein Van01_41730 [Micromonospora andamanensis]
MAAYRDVRALQQSTDALEVARKFFEPQLSQLGLGKDQIQRQTLDELKISLEVIDKAADHPDSFGKLRVSITPQSGAIIVKDETSAHFEVGILPILLERRMHILARIRALEVEQEVSNLEEELAQSSDDAEKSRLIEDELEEKRGEETLLQERLTGGAGVANSGREELLFQVELQARKTAIRQSWFARESVASLVGGLLLMVLATTMIVAMFAGTTVSDIISNAFLVILGYFFGQAVRERPDQAVAANSPRE